MVRIFKDSYKVRRQKNEEVFRCFISFRLGSNSLR